MDYKIKIVDHTSKENQAMFEHIAQLTRPLNKTYPQYDRWLQETFFKGVENGSRKIVVACDEEDNLLGVALLKDTEEEKKLCCLFVREDCRAQGLGSNLLKKSFEVLQTNRPLITVSEENLPKFQSLLDQNNCVFSYKKRGAYRENSVENYFNNEATEKLRTNILTPLFSYILKQNQKR